MSRVIGSARIDGSAVGGTPGTAGILSQDGGLASVVRSGPGTYSIVPASGGWDADEVNVQVTAEGALPLIATVEHVSDEELAVYLTDPSYGPADGTFKVQVSKYKY